MPEDLNLEKLGRTLARFAPPDFDAWDWCDWARFTLNDQIPLPGLAQMTLAWGCGARELGRPEKTRWSVGFTYDGTSMALALQKFGPRLYVDFTDIPTTGDFPSQVMDMLRSLSAAVRIVEREILPELAAEQVRAGLCTMPNDHYRIRRMYHYFRAAAEKPAPSTSRDTSPLSITSEFARIATFAEASQEVAYNRFAAVTSYFSWLEHLLTLLLAFSNFDPAAESIQEFMGKKWGDKWNRIFPRSEPESMRRYNELRVLAEDERNHYAHGGLSRGESLWFHLPRFGAMPMTLTQFEDRPTFRYFEPDIDAAHAQSRSVWDALDALDEWLKSGIRGRAFEFVESGMDVRFDPKFRSEFEAAAEHDDTFAEWMMDLSELSDRAHNFE